MTETAAVSSVRPRIHLRAVTAEAWSALVVAVAVVIRIFAPLSSDTNWLMSNCRRFLDGAVLYRDIVETNPPMAIFMHLPAALVERWTRIEAETVFTAMVLVCGAGAAWFFARCVRRVEPEARFILPVTLAVVVVAPLSAFDEREHVALILTLPLIGLAVLRAGGMRPSWVAMVACGVLAGLTPLIKPYFALGVAGPYLALAMVQRLPRAVLAPEAVVAGAVTLAGVGATELWLPDYGRSVVPLLFDLYRPMKEPLWWMLCCMPVIAWTVSLAGLYVAERRLGAVVWAIVGGGIGYMIGFIDQGRGWSYQMLPSLGLLLIALYLRAPAALLSGSPRRRVPAVAAIVMAVGMLAYLGMFDARTYTVVGPIRATVASPTVMSISWDLTPGHPITTRVNGRWAGTFSSRWITVNAAYLSRRTHDPVRLKRYAQWTAYDRMVTNRDLGRRPDIVLVGLGPFDWPGWIARDPETKRLMDGYVLLARDRLSPERRARFEGVEAWIRKDLVKQ